MATTWAMAMADRITTRSTALQQMDTHFAAELGIHTNTEAMAEAIRHYNSHGNQRLTTHTATVHQMEEEAPTAVVADSEDHLLVLVVVAAMVDHRAAQHQTDSPMVGEAVVAAHQAAGRHPSIQTQGGHWNSRSNPTSRTIPHSVMILNTGYGEKA